MPMTFEFSSEQDANAFDAAVEQRFKLESRIGIGVNTHGDPDGVVWVQVPTVRVSEDCQVTGRTKHWWTGRGAPDRSKYRWCERRYRIARHRPDLAPGPPGRIPQSPTTWTREYSSSLPGPVPFGDGVRDRKSVV